MKIREIKLKRPVKILQVFRNIVEYSKAEKSFDKRKEEINWGAIQSKSGYVLDHELYLPDTIIEDPGFNNCDLITMVDDNPLTSFASTGKQYKWASKYGYNLLNNHCFNLGHSREFEIFNIKNDGVLELYLKYGYFEVGIPERGNFKLCDIRKQSPVEIKINGKTDFSLSSRRARVFQEKYYVFEYIGDFNKINLLREPYDHIIKHIPSDRKVVDLIKPLW
ncbi:hypothetical protein OCK74_19950 [Chitinophagaceae bacterium LB-8]|uniref:Uncharacterized protein n=1 Tax=Paraflavisolibacter caeni TaxID=2982496 RepID=A0A9X3B9J9_9BACT|nr:hypothetical protein [Paraflavisolibacter caeni]MCU7551406.1 hypothetical protein [Paraflavisolibacter caeni]